MAPKNTQQQTPAQANDYDQMVPGAYRGDFAFLNYDPKTGHATLFQRARFKDAKKDSFVRYDIDGLKKLHERLRAVLAEIIKAEKKKLQALSEDA